MSCPTVEIPRGDFETPGPCWIPTRHQDGKWARPVIRCKCGTWTGIGLHHVRTNGSVWASFFDSQAPTFTHKGKTYSHPPGCGWHVYLVLRDYDCGEFLPED